MLEIERETEIYEIENLCDAIYERRFGEGPKLVTYFKCGRSPRFVTGCDQEEGRKTLSKISVTFSMDGPRATDFLFANKHND